MTTLHDFRGVFEWPLDTFFWALTIRVVTPLSSHSRRSENGDVAPSPRMAEGPFSENGKPNFVSSAGEEWRILGEGFTTGLMFLSWGRFFHRFCFSILREGHKGVSHLSPWRSNPIGSSFSLFSIPREPILRPRRRCDNLY